MNVLTLYSNILRSYSEKVGIKPIIPRKETPVALSTTPVKNIYIRKPEPSTSVVYKAPTPMEIPLDMIPKTKYRKRFVKTDVIKVSTDVLIS